MRGEDPLRGRRRGRGRGRERAGRRGGVARDRGHVRAAACGARSRRRDRASGVEGQREGQGGQRLEARAPRVRRRRGDARCERRGGGGRILVRGLDPHADRAALRDRPLRPDRIPHGLVQHPGGPLPAPRSGTRARPADAAHPRDPAGGGRRIRREERAVLARVLRRQAVDDHRAPDQDPLHPRGGVLRAPRAPPHAARLPLRGPARRHADRGRREDRDRRRRVLVVRPGHHVLLGAAPHRALPHAGLPVRLHALLHQQALLRPQARARLGAAALRLRMPARQARGGDRDGSDRATPQEPHR